MNNNHHQPTKPTQPSRILFEKSYEQEMAEQIERKNIETAKRFGVPLWVLRHPGKRIEVEDDPIDE